MTDRELTQQLADSENYYRSLIHNLHEDIIVIDSNYTITDMNNSFLATVGQSAEDVIGHNCYEVSHGYDNPCDQYGEECPLRKVFDTGLSSRCRHTHTGKNGAKVYKDVLASPIKDSDGNITHVVEAVRDITDLMEAQAQLRASNQQYRSVVEDSPVLICRFAPGGTIEFVNDAYCRYFAKTAQELVGSDFLSLIPAGSREAITANISALTADSPVSSHEHQVIAEDGEIRWQRWTNRALFDEEGQVVAYQSFGEDVTERKKAETAMENMGQRLKLALQAANIGVWNWDLVTDEVYFSPEWKAQIGYAEDELPNVYEEWENRLHPEDREQTLRALRAYREGQIDKHVVEFRLRHKDGSYRWIFARGEILLDDSGKPVRMNGCHVDITDRVRAEKELQEKKDFAESLIATAQVIVLVLDTEGRIVRFNPYMEMISGYSLDEVRGKDWISTFLPRRDRKHIRKLLLQAVNDIQTRGNVNALVTKDGQERRIEWYDKTLKDREGNIVGLLSIGHDITEREETAKALRTSQERFEQVAEHAQEMIWETDADGLYTYASPVVERILGYSPEEIVGKKHFYDLFHPEQQREMMIAAFETFARKEPFREFPNLNVHKNGQAVWLSTSGVPLLDGDGNLVGYRGADTNITERKQTEDVIRNLARFPSENPYPVLRIRSDGTILYANPTAARLLANQGLSTDGQAPDDWRRCAASAMESGAVMRREFHYDHETFALHFTPLANAGYVNVYGVDITEQKDMEAQLRQAQKMEAVGRLAGGIAHDFRNQLTVIIGYAEWLLSRMDDDSESASNTREILDAAKRSTRLTGHLLAFSRRKILDSKVVNPMALIDSLTNPLKHMIGEDVVLVTSGADDLDDINIDPDQFEQMLMNLAVNARDAMPDGGKLKIDVTSAELDSKYARRHIDARPGKYVAIAVADTGVGMDAKTRQNAFDPFFTTKGAGEGTGLGLSMVHGFARQSGGYITVDSEVGRGTTFTIYLPVTTEPPRETAPIETAPAKDANATGVILAVEDDERLRNMLTGILRENGHTVMTAGNAREAIPLGEHYDRQIDLLITDVIMPGMNGVELADRLKAVRPDMAVLFISGYGDSELIRRGLAAGNAQLLLKPFGTGELLDAVNHMLV